MGAAEEKWAVYNLNKYSLSCLSQLGPWNIFEDGFPILNTGILLVAMLVYRKVVHLCLKMSWYTLGR